MSEDNDTPLVREALEAAKAGDAARFARLWSKATEAERWTLRGWARVKSIVRDSAVFMPPKGAKP